MAPSGWMHILTLSTMESVILGRTILLTAKADPSVKELLIQILLDFPTERWRCSVVFAEERLLRGLAVNCAKIPRKCHLSDVAGRLCSVN
jgi:hypothetical protein